MRNLSSVRPRSAAAGFTMIELMIAILILLVGIVAVAKLVPAAIDTNFRNRNDSTGLIAAQRQLEQMARQPLDAQIMGACAAAPVGEYYFCDTDTDMIPLGDIDATLGPSVTTERGCPLTATGQLDFTQPAANCDAGYMVNKQWVWNPVTGTNQNVELRWRVITWHVLGQPKRKVFIVGARAGTAGQSLLVTNLQTVVGR